MFYRCQKRKVSPEAAVGGDGWREAVGWAAAAVAAVAIASRRKTHETIQQRTLLAWDANFKRADQSEAAAAAAVGVKRQEQKRNNIKFKQSARARNKTRQTKQTQKQPRTTTTTTSLACFACARGSNFSRSSASTVGQQSGFAQCRPARWVWANTNFYLTHLTHLTPALCR